MTDDDAFVRAVCEFPDDDTPRLVYADWLEEWDGEMPCPQCRGSGDPNPAKFVTYSPQQQRLVYEKPPGARCSTCSGTGSVPNGYAARARFIRVQCELARLDPAAPHNHPGWPVSTADDCRQCRAGKLRRRERELWTTPRVNGYAPAWHWFTKELGISVVLDGYAHDRSNPPTPFGVASRGFISQLTLPAAAFTPDLARAMFAAQPCTSVVLSDREPHESGFSDHWIWLRDSDTASRMAQREYVPESLFDLLDGRAIPGNVPLAHKQYRTRDLALAALSAACVGYGRALVGLPPGRG